MIKKLPQLSLFILLTFFIQLFVLSQTALACSCVSMESDIEDSGAVFTGKVVSIKYPEPVNGIMSSADPAKVTFEVYQSWKGPKTKNITIYTALSSASCGYEFDEGREYLVYADIEEGNLEVSLCSGTSLLSADKAQRDISFFPSSQELGQNSNSTSFMMPLLASLGVIAIVFVVYKLLSWRKNKSGIA